jgi:predicted phage terminase large subunit-like protein
VVAIDSARQVAELPRVEFFRRWRGIEDAEDRKEALRLRFRYDLEAFCRYCWPDRFDLPFNALHASLFSRADCLPWNRRRDTERDAVAAPRGYAKSTISSFAQIVHAIVYDLEGYIVLMSAGKRLALSLGKDIKNAFTAKESLLADLYGPFKVTGVTSEFEISVRRRPSVGILCASFGSEIRGAKHPTRGIRPTLVVIDDGEKKDRVRNAEQRAIWWATLTKDILKLGRRQGGTRYWMRGTVLHVDSMLQNALTSPGWKSEKWKAIISWPERPELWEECGRIWKNLRLGDEREVQARAFYEANRAEMDRGVQVLDPGVEDIYALYTQIWGEGLASFLQEKQNEPRDSTATYFNSAKFAKCKVTRDHIIAKDGHAIPLSAVNFTIRLDPIPGDELGSMGDEGGSGEGDYAAIAVIGMDSHGYGYVVEVWMKRARDSEQLAMFWTLAEKWKARRGSIETNGFARLFGRDFRRMQTERKNAGLYYQIVVDDDVSTTRKEDRIASLEPAIEADWLQFSEAIPQPVLEQFDDFPTGAHDDAPDAIEGAWRQARAPRQGGGRIV